MSASAGIATPPVVCGFLSDERLARLAARGDTRAFGVLYERYRPQLERYCRSILRHGADAEDAAQNAMVAALRALEGGTVPIAVKPWLYRIAHNEAITVARRRRPSEELDERMVGAAAADEPGAVRERLAQLLTDLKALTERQREALVLRELCGLSYGEIASTLGSTEAAAQQTVFEARSALMAFGEGRALACEGVQRAMSECDGMRLRTRRVRAHVRGCDGCRAFEAALRARRRDLGLLFPAGGGFVAGLARLLGLGLGGRRLAGALTLKGAALGAALLAGGGALVLATTPDAGRQNSSPARISSPAPGGAVAARPAAAPAAPAARHAAARRGAAGANHAARAKRRPARHAVAAPTATAIPASLSPSDARAPASEVASSGAPSSDRAAAPTGGGGGTTTGHRTPQHTASQVVGTVGQTVTQTASTATQAIGDVTQQVAQTTTTATDTATGAVTTATDAVKNATGVGLP